MVVVSVIVVYEFQGEVLKIVFNDKTLEEVFPVGFTAPLTVE